jgi:hypothetical protein
VLLDFKLNFPEEEIDGKKVEYLMQYTLHTQHPDSKKVKDKVLDALVAKVDIPLFCGDHFERGLLEESIG